MQACLLRLIIISLVKKGYIFIIRPLLKPLLYLRFYIMFRGVQRVICKLKLFIAYQWLKTLLVLKRLQVTLSAVV